MKLFFATHFFRPRFFACAFWTGPTAVGPFAAGNSTVHQAGAESSLAFQAGRQHPDHQHVHQAGPTRRSVIPIP